MAPSGAPIERPWAPVAVKKRKINPSIGQTNKQRRSRLCYAFTSAARPPCPQPSRRRRRLKKKKVTVTGSVQSVELTKKKNINTHNFLDSVSWWLATVLIAVKSDRTRLSEEAVSLSTPSLHDDPEWTSAAEPTTTTLQFIKKRKKKKRRPLALCVCDLAALYSWPHINIEMRIMHKSLHSQCVSPHGSSVKLACTLFFPRKWTRSRPLASSTATVQRFIPRPTSTPPRVGMVKHSALV